MYDKKILRNDVLPTNSFTIDLICVYVSTCTSSLATSLDLNHK